MSKKPPTKVEQKSDTKGPKSLVTDFNKYFPSVFTLTFVIEVVGIDVWHDCNEGWLDLGPEVKGVKVSYELYLGQHFEVNVVIWPHVAKVMANFTVDSFDILKLHFKIMRLGDAVLNTTGFLNRFIIDRFLDSLSCYYLPDYIFLVHNFALLTFEELQEKAMKNLFHTSTVSTKLPCHLLPSPSTLPEVVCGTNYGWVRTWQFLERRWLTFSIRHAFPVRVTDLCTFEATVTPNFGIGVLGASLKAELPTEVYLPPLRFGESRQFAKVVDAEYPFKSYIQDMIWFLVVNYIPISFMDGLFDTPYPVQDVRHQDAVKYQVQDVILNGRVEEEEEEEEEDIKLPKGKHIPKDIKKKPTEKIKNEIKLSGDWILAGIGRVTPFVITGDPTGLGEVIALISSNNLPADDDFPVFFVNVCNLTYVPIENLIQNRFTHIYTRWTISEDERNSEQQPLKTKILRTEVDFNDHHSVPLPSAVAWDVMAAFLDEPFRVELRGIRIPPPIIKKSTFFGYEKTDRDFGIGVPPPIPNQDVDVLIAQTRIDARALTKINGSVKGDFPLYPPEASVVPLEREGVCTNDVNAVRATVKPDFIIQPSVILEAQMMIEVSLGIVGCKPKSDAEIYSRLYCLISDREAIMSLLYKITEINESVTLTESKGGLLTGFALDTGDTVMLYVEGPKEGHILRIWERAQDFYPGVKPIFSTSAKYRCRLYPELLLAAIPFNIMKMFVPLSVLLGLTPIYARPALPLPSRSAVLKIGRLVASKFKSPPCCHAMPTATELKSFRLELCVAPRPLPVHILAIPRVTSAAADSWEQPRPSVHSVTKINWKKK